MRISPLRSPWIAAQRAILESNLPHLTGPIPPVTAVGPRSRPSPKFFAQALPTREILYQTMMKQGGYKEIDYAAHRPPSVLTAPTIHPEGANTADKDKNTMPDNLCGVDTFARFFSVYARCHGSALGVFTQYVIPPTGKQGSVPGKPSLAIPRKKNNRSARTKAPPYSPENSPPRNINPDETSETLPFSAYRNIPVSGPTQTPPQDFKTTPPFHDAVSPTTSTEINPLRKGK